MNSTEPGWQRWLVHTLIVAQIVALCCGRAVFTQDLPDWVYQGYLMHDLLSGGPGSDQFFLKAVPVPNSATTILAYVLAFAFSAETTSKLITAGLLCAWVAAVELNLRRIDSGNRAALHAVLFATFATGTVFWGGADNFQFGLALLLGFLARREWFLRRTGRLIILSLLAFFCHFLIYGALLLWITWLCRIERRMGRLWALLPSLALLGWYAASRIGQEALGDSVQYVWNGQLAQFVTQDVRQVLSISPFKNFILWDGTSFLSPWQYAALTILIIGSAVLTWTMALWRPDLIPKAAWPAVALLVIGPCLPFMFYGTVMPGLRLLMIAVAVLLLTRHLPPLPMRILGALAVLAIVHGIVFTLFYDDRYSPPRNDLATGDIVWAQPDGTTRLGTFVEHFRRQAYFSVSPFDRASDYARADAHDWSAKSMWRTGLIDRRRSPP